MESMRSQAGRIFGAKASDMGDYRREMLPQVEQVLKENGVSAAAISMTGYRGGVDLGINLPSGWAVLPGKGIVGCGARPAVGSGIVESLLQLPEVKRVTFWDAAGRCFMESYGTSIPVMISTIVRKYSNPDNRGSFEEEFKQLDDALTEAHRPEGEDLGKSLGRLSQQEIYQFYGMFRKMLD